MDLLTEGIVQVLMSRGRGRERMLEPQRICGIWLPGQNQLPRQENKYYM
jgi:hypothetical protein